MFCLNLTYFHHNYIHFIEKIVVSVSVRQGYWFTPERLASVEKLLGRECELAG